MLYYNLEHHPKHFGITYIKLKPPEYSFGESSL